MIEPGTGLRRTVQEPDCHDAGRALGRLVEQFGICVHEGNRDAWQQRSSIMHSCDAPRQRTNRLLGVVAAAVYYGLQVGGGSRLRFELFIAVIAAFGAARGVAAQKPFEGTIVYDVVSGDKAMQMTVTSRGGTVRRDVSMPDAPAVSQGNYQMIDFRSGEATMVFPAMKRYMVIRVGGLRDGATDAAIDPAADIQATSRVETIAGARCTVYTMKSVPDNEWCITSRAKSDAELGALMNDSPASGGPAPGLLRGFLRGTVVLRARMLDRSGGVTTMVARKIDRATPPAALFQMPADFQEMKNPSMP